MSTKILIVEDDIDLQKTLCDFIRNEGFIVDTCSSGSEALRKIEKLQPNLVLLDLGLPDIQGEDVLKKVRVDYPHLAVVILTAKSKPQEIAEGLNLGADDYLPKPFSVEELLARINARIKTRKLNNPLLTAGDLVLDLSKMIAKRSKRKIKLTKTEYDLLRYLLENKGIVLTRDMILNHIWDYSSEVESRVVDVYIGYLRRKIDSGFPKKLIKNRRGFGYLIEE
ncbi:MAG TPA: response regulator transcription factor [Patescibacteria group bacterium]|nr:response regulator transcription factor [Patescibacteria group bacterium]